MMKRGPAILITILFVVFFSTFFIYPVGMVVKQAFEGTHPDKSHFFTLEFFGVIFRNPIYREGLGNAFLLGLGSTLAALVIAFPLALTAHRYNFFGKSWVGIWVLTPMILPPFVGAVGLKQLLGINGALNALLMKVGLMDAAFPYDWLAQGRLTGIILMNALHLYPILYMNISASLGNLDPGMEQAAENLGCPPWKRFFRITLPLAMPGVFAGASIVFIWAFTELGVPLVFDYSRVAPVQIFDGLKGLDKNPIPYALTALLLLVAACVFSFSKLVLGRSALGKAPRPQMQHSSIRVYGLKSFACFTLFMGVFMFATIPHLGVILLSFASRWYGTVIPDAFTLRHYQEALGNSLVVPSIQNSLWYAGCATLAALLLGVTLSWVVARSNLRFRNLLDSFVMLPLAVPGLVMAFGYLALSQEGKAFHFLLGPSGSPFLLIVIAYAIRRLPYVVRSAVAGLQQSNPALEEAALCLGATPVRMLRRIALPLIGANLAAGAILAFAFSMLEVSDSLILAQQEEHYPITKAIYALLSTLGNGTELAAALGVWSMVFLSVAMVGATMLSGNRRSLFKI